MVGVYPTYLIRKVSALFVSCPSQLKTNPPPLLCFELHCIGGFFNYCSEFLHINVPTVFSTRSPGVTTYITPYSLTSLSFINSHLSVHLSHVRLCGTTRLYGFPVIMCYYIQFKFVPFVRRIDTRGINFANFYNELDSSTQLKQVPFW